MAIYLTIILKVIKIFAYTSKYRSRILKYQICTEGIFHAVLNVFSRLIQHEIAESTHLLQNGKYSVMEGISSWSFRHYHTR
jgi:hypothetical protein